MSSPGRSKSSTTSPLGAIPPRKHTDAHSSDPVRLRFTPPTTSSPQQDDSVLPADLLSNGDGTWPRRSEPAFHTRSTSQPYVAGAPRRRTSIGPSVVMSSISSMPSKGSLPPAKQSGFRATVRRMFGARKHPPSLANNSTELNYSDPGNLIANETPRSETWTPQEPYQLVRPVSRPPTVSSALHSHSPSTPLRQPSSGVIADLSPQRRRNTLPSLVLSDGEAQVFARSLTTCLNGVHADHDPRLEQLVPDSRRSRSLEELANEQHARLATVPRPDREAEIAYWRNSVLLGRQPTLPVNHLDGEAEDGDDDISVDSNGDHSDHGRERGVTDDIGDDVDTHIGSPQLSRLPTSTVKPVQSFDFGLSVDDEPVALEERVNTLEVKMYDFEYAIAKLQGIELPKPALPTRMPRSRSTQELVPRASRHSSSTDSSARRMMSFSRPRPIPPSKAAVLDHADPFPANGAEPPRPQTSHGHRSSSALTSSIHLTRTEYDTLMSLIGDEKAARQQMEMQILDLRKEVQQLQSPIFAAINYPLSGVDGLNNTQRAKTLHRTSPFDFSRAPQHPSRFSVDTEAEFQSDGFEEVYETPKQSFAFDTGRRPPMINVS